MTIESLFEYAAKKGASDVHLVSNLRPVIRLDGELVYAGEKEVSPKGMDILVKELLSKEQYDHLMKTWELDTSFQTKDGSRFRVNVHFERGNLGVTARVISQHIPTLEEIGMLDIVGHLLHLNQGLIMVTGPTGCGKSTTLAAMVEDINVNQNRNIITLEDPIEFLFDSKKSIVIQRQLGTDMKTFESALKHVVRQDPDVIMVGEMRDLETIAAAITLAETGHLVLATLHTYNAAQTIDRIIDIFPPHQQNQVRMQLASVLAAVVSQRLLIRQGGGRIAGREVLINTPAIANLIREGKISQVQTVLETHSKEGMITMEKSLNNLFKEGLISQEEMDSHLLEPWAR